LFVVAVSRLEQEYARVKSDIQRQQQTMGQLSARCQTAEAQAEAEKKHRHKSKSQAQKAFERFKEEIKQLKRQLLSLGQPVCADAPKPVRVFAMSVFCVF
jgi:phage shock protein A